MWLTGCPKHKIHPIAVKAQDDCSRAVTRGRYEKAENYARLALRYNPKYADAFNCLALVEIGRGNLGQAERLLKKALSINSNFADARSNLGDIYFKKKDFKRARYLFKSALDIDPKLGNAGYNMARVLIQLRQYKEARDQVIQSLFFPANKRQPRFHYLLGYIEFERKNFKRAVKHWLDCIKLNPNHLPAHLSTCKALYQLSQFGAACYHCKKVTQIDPNHVDGKRSLAAVRIKIRQYNQTCP